MQDLFEVIKKYNFWDNQKPNLGLLRDVYLQKFSAYLGNQLIKVITGQRRTGKSYLIRQLIFYLHEKGVNPINILYINKEYIEFDFIRNGQDLRECINLYLNKTKPKGKVYLFFDEVQLIYDWEKTVNSYSQDHTNEYEVFISGSNSTLLSGELATLLSGRYITFHVYPYSFKEYCLITNKIPGKQEFINYLISGGLPELVNLNNLETKQHYINDLKNTIVLKDIVIRHRIMDVGLLDRIFTYLAQNISNPVSIQNIVNYFNNMKVTTNFNTISSYIEYLKETFVIHEVPRYDMKGKKILGSNKKYYLNDLSFRNLLYPGFEPGLGYLLENAIFIELKRNGYDVFTGTDRNMEIDFVIKKGGLVKYIQSCYLLIDDTVIEREFGNLDKIRDNYEKMVISLDDVSFGNKNGIFHHLAWNMDIYQ